MLAIFRMLPNRVLGQCEWPGTPPPQVILPATSVASVKDPGAVGVDVRCAMVLFSRTGITELPDGSRAALYETSDPRAVRCVIEALV